MGDELIVLRSGQAEQTSPPIIGPCPPGAVRMNGQCVSGGGVAGTGETCTTAADCPPLTQVLINACAHYECIEQACTIVSNCDPETEQCDGAAHCEVRVPRDANITVLHGPEAGPFPSPLAPADFEAARQGPKAFVAGLYLDTCVNSVIEDGQARFVDPVSNLTGEPDTTALFAIDFEVTSPAILNASLDIYMRVDDELGGGGNQGIFINGQPLSGDTTGGFCSGFDSMHIHRDDVAPMLLPGTNTLYFNVTRTADKAQVIFYVELRVDSDGPAIFRVDDDAAPNGDGSTWETAYDNLENALAAAEASNDPQREIWLAEGVYKPPVPEAPADPRLATFVMVPGVTVYGGFEGSELVREDRDPDLYDSRLSGDLSGNDFLTPTNPTWADNAYSVVTINQRDPRGLTVLDGVTITHGNANALAGPGTGGGGVRAVADAVIVGSRIIENGGTSGGGIYATDRLELIDCDVSSNYAQGIFAWSTAEVILTSCRFDGNAAQSGPGIFLWGQSIADEPETRLQATGCSFTHNTALYNGGVFYNNYRCTIELTDCYIADNRAENNDGGVAHIVSDASVTAAGCTFERNSAGGNKGCFDFDQSEGYFDHCTFRENDGHYGPAGIYAFDNCHIEVRHCTFEDNLGSGGNAIFASGRSSLVLENSVFERNRDTDTGGAVELGYGMTYNIVNCAFRNNTTRNRGGAVWVNGSASAGFATANFINCEFVGNECWGPQPSYWSWGGAVAARDAIVSFNNCTVAYNDAGLSAIYAQNSLISVENSIVRGNTDDNGGGFASQISGDETSLITITQSNVQGIAPGDGNIDEDPLFVELPSDGGDGWADDNNTLGDLHVRLGSPCIDAGDNGLLPADIADLNGNGDTAETLPYDLSGAPRRMDDVAADTGAGTPPIVDMGAYEHLSGDCNHDGAVTLADAADLIACMAGPDAGAETGCACHDLNASGTVDLVDVGLFQMLLGVSAID